MKLIHLYVYDNDTSAYKNCKSISLIVFTIALVNTPRSLKIESQCFPSNLKKPEVSYCYDYK